jgi:hypothetical protein
MSTEPAGNGHQVGGRIFFDHGLPAEHLRVRIYHRGYGCKAKLLGETQTTEGGHYSLAYTPTEPLTNLEVRVVSDKDEEVSISATKYSAQSSEVFNLVAPTRARPLAPEYERISADLQERLREGGAIADARENRECQDITLLHRATQWDARLIALLATAAKLSRETRMEEEVLYALLRNGLPSDKKLLAHVKVAAVEKALKKAVASNIVGLSSREITAAKSAFKSFSWKIRRTSKATGAPSTFADLLNKTGLNKSEKVIFENLYFNHKGSAASLWEKAAQKGIPAAKIERMKLQGKLAYLTLNNAAVAEEIRKEVDASGGLGALVDNDLYRADEWKKRLLSMAGTSKPALSKLIPPAYSGETTGERLQAYCADLARKVRRSLPTRVVARMIEQDELHLGEQHQALKAPVSAALKNAEALGFSMGRLPLNTFLAQHKSEVFDGVDDEDVEAATSAVKRLNRLYQITPTDEALQLALNEGFNSAYDVVSVPYETFMSSYGDKFSSDLQTSTGIADNFYRKAQQVASTTYNFFMSAKQMESAPAVYAMSPPASVVEDAKNELIKHYPTMESLFGSLDFCECDACRSVLSPAAYLVDLLQFLNPGDVAWSNFQNIWKSTHGGEDYTDAHQKAYDALIERRPDIPHLPLTCENTQTVLPYIDIVNEILEYYVAEGSLGEDAVRDTGQAASADLLAEPQNILKEAYDKLKDAWYPIGLPFDLWLETVRRFSDHFSLPLWHVLELFRSTDQLFLESGDTEPYDMSAVFLEYLNISPAESAIITSADPEATWHLLYGFDDETKTDAQNQQAALTALASAKTLSRQLGVSYKQLLELVRTGFVNPELDALVVLQKLGVEVTDVFTYKNNEQLLEANKEDLSDQELALWNDLDAFRTRLEELSDTFTGFDAVQWLNQSWQQNVFDKVLVLADPDSGCNFDQTTLRYADGTSADALALIKLNLFVRLWKKLGWTIEETDRALQAFLPANSLPLAAAGIGEALKTALIYLAQFKRLDEGVKVGTNRRIKLLTLWSNLPTTGTNPLYAQLFLTKSILKQDEVFDDPLGNYLSQSGVLIKDHLLVLQAALGLTANEITGILVDAGQEIETETLSLESVSTLYRYGLLAKALKLSVQELITLKSLSGLDPFKPLSPDPLNELEEVYPFTQTLRFIDVAAMLKESGFRIEELDYLFRHRFDPVGEYQENPDAALALVKSLAAELERIRDEQAISGTPTEDQLRQKLALVLTPETLAGFIGAITGTAETEAVRENIDAQARLDPKLLFGEQGLRLSYREVEERQRLACRGLLLDEKKDALKSAAGAPQLLKDLLDDVQTLGFASLAAQIESVLSALMGTVEYHAVLENVQPADKLDPDAFNGEAAIRVAYDETSATQHLTWRGLLLEAKKQELNDAPAVPSSVLAALLDAVQSQAMNDAEAVIKGSLAVLISTLEFQAVEENVLLADKLDPNSFDPRFSVSYDDAPPWDTSAQYQKDDVVSFNDENWIALRANTGVQPLVGPDWSGQQGRKQTLSVRGLLSQTKIDELQAKIQSSALPTLLANIQNQTNAFVAKLRVGLFADPDPNSKLNDFDALFAALPELCDASEAPRARLAEAVLPFIIRHLTNQLVVQTLSSSLDANSDLIEALLTDGYLLADPSEPGRTLMDAFASAGDKGISAMFFAAPDGSGNPLEMKVVPTADTQGKPGGANSVRFEGYLQVPSAGPYRFFALSKEALDAEVELRLGDLPDPLLRAKVETENAEFSAFVELKQGVANVFTFHADNLNGGRAWLLVQGENLPKGTLSQLSLSPSQSVERVRRAAVLLSKSLDIIKRLALTEREVRYVLTHASDFDGVSFNKLPTRETDESQAQEAVALFGYLLRLIRYSGLKHDVSGETDDLMGIFENARRTIYPAPTDPSDVELAENELFDDLCQRFADLTRREFELVRETALSLGFGVDSDPIGDELRIKSEVFANEKSLWRLWDALRAVESLGVGLAAIINSTEIVSATKTQDERFDIASNLRNMVKARYETENWQRIAKPIFDKLRQGQRDALVAWIMHSDGFERIEQLFEYFLIDPGMEPVVQTSRLRLAISSVQLFIQRCLLNLELKVDPSAINANHWEWMKRYRVWEANRKIFLFPENWLEPEFRDDKTHLFKELESKLLEGDVSSDLVEDAFFNYLRKLEELARLDIVAIYCEEKLLDPATNVVHVVGRTFSLPHKYFYRYYQYGMWTPWEPVSAEIDGDHLVLMMWRGRLHLFWVTFLEKPKQDTSGDSIEVVGGSVNVPTSPKRQVDVQLNWCEYFQGQWTTRESSGFSRPLTVTVSRRFNKRGVFIYAFKEYDSQGEETAVRIQLCGEKNLQSPENVNQFKGSNKWKTAFRVVSKYSPPAVVQRAPLQPHPKPYETTAAEITRYKGSDAFVVRFAEKSVDDGSGPPDNTVVDKAILQDVGSYSIVMPEELPYLAAPQFAPLISPFFFQDKAHTFFVEPTLTENTFIEWEDWTIQQPEWELDIDDIVLESNVPEWVDPAGPITYDPLSIYELEFTTDWVTADKTLLAYDQAWVGVSGGVNVQVLPEMGSNALDQIVNLGSQFSPALIGAGGLNSVALTGIKSGINNPAMDVGGKIGGN